MFATVRQSRVALLGAVLLGLLTAVLGVFEAPLPAAVGRTDNGVPMWRLFALGAAVLPVLALYSPLADLEQAATRKLRSAQRAYFALLTIVTIILYLGISAAGISWDVTLVLARSFLGWTGLGLVAGALLGWRLAWTLPSAVAIVLWYWGIQAEGVHYWWEFSARPADALSAWTLSLVLFGVGLACYGATPWRRSWLRRRLRARPSRRAG